MIGHSSSIFASLQVDDFHKRNQISNDFVSVLKKVSAKLMQRLKTRNKVLQKS